MRTPLYYTFTLILILIAASQVEAQRADKLISTFDRGYRMLEAAKVQVADSANGTVAVVWGTTEPSGTNRFRIALYVQILRYGKTIGRPLRLGDNNNRLTGAVRITALEDNFLILYYDTAQAGKWGTYSQFLDVEKESLGAPQWLDHNDIGISSDLQNLIVTGSSKSGWRLFWFALEYWWRTDIGLRTFVFDSTGVPRSTGEWIGSQLTTLITYDKHPRLGILCDPMGISHAVDRATGQLDPRSLPKLGTPFHLASDTSLLIIRDSVLYLYRSLFDSVARQRTLPLAQWGVGSQLRGGQPWPQSLVYRDDAGRITLYLAAGKEGGAPWSTQSANYTAVRIRLDSLQAPAIIDTVYVESDSGEGASEHWVVEYLTSPECNNRWQLRVSFGTHSHEALRYLYYMNLDEDGNIHRSNSPLTDHCQHRPMILPRRLPIDSVSAVEIIIPDTLVLSLPTVRQEIPDHTNPGIASFAKGIVCTWRQSDTVAPDRLRQWDLSLDSVGSIQTYRLPSTNSVLPPGSSYTSRSVTITDTAVQVAGDCGIVNNYYSYGMLKGWGGTGDFESPATAWQYAIARPAENGWRIAELESRLDNTSAPPFITTITVAHFLGYDPETHDIVVLLSTFDWDPISTSLRSRTLRGLCGDGTQWSLDSPNSLNERSTIIPVGTGSYILIDSAQSSYIKKNVVEGSFTLESNDHLRSRYYKLHGPCFARTSWSEADTTRFRIEKFDLDGKLLDSISIKRSESRDDYMLVQSPTDSMIAIVFGGSSGVRGTFVTKNLKLCATDTLLSATTGSVSHPAGTFRNDTLFVVWEDYRDGASRIYGTFHRLGSWAIAGVDNRLEIPETGGSFITPNPANGAIHLSANFQQNSIAELNIINILGETVYHQIISVDNAGWQSIPVSINGLPAGTYIARLRHRTGVLVQMIVKK